MLAIFMVMIEKLKGFFSHKKKRSLVAQHVGTRAIQKVNPSPQRYDATRDK